MNIQEGKEPSFSVADVIGVVMLFLSVMLFFNRDIFPSVVLAGVAIYLFHKTVSYRKENEE